MGSLRDRVAASAAYKTERVLVPEWDAEVEIRSITVQQHSDLLIQSMPDGKTVNMAIMIPRLLVMAVYDPETGDYAFTEADADMLSGLPAGVVERLGFTAMRLSGIDKDAVESGKGDS